MSLPDGKISAAFEARAISHQLDDIYMSGIEELSTKYLARIKSLAERANALANRLGGLIIDKMPPPWDL